MKIVLSQENGEIAFYSQRSRLRKYLVLFLSLDLVWIVLLIVFLLIASGFLFVRPSPEPSLVIAVQIFMSILSLLALFILTLLFSLTVFTMRRCVSHKPALLITHQGINFRDLPVTGNTFFSWSEISSLSVVPLPQLRSKPIKYFCLDPKDHAQFLSRFHLLRRFFILLDTVSTGTLVHMPQWFLLDPVEDVLLQIQESFQDELRMYQIATFNTRNK